MSGQPRLRTDQRAAGEHAARLAASWCRRRLGRDYAKSAWQILADAARLGIIRLRRGRRDRPRVSGLIGAGRALSAQQVADEFGVTLGTLAVTERELAHALHLARYAQRSLARSEA